MAKKTRTELSTLAINTNLPDNTQELITPTTERSQLTDERESVINYKDDLGGTGNAGKFLTVATDGESLTMVDEPSGVPDWVTFITAVRNQMLLKAGGDGTGTTEAWLKFTSYDGTTTAQINFNGIDGSLYINGSQSQMQLSSAISFIIGGTPRLTISSTGLTQINSTNTTALELITNQSASSLRLKNTGSIVSDWIMQSGGINAGDLSFYNLDTSAYRLTISSGGDATFAGLIKFVDPTAGSAGTPQFKTLLSYQYSTINALSTIKGGNEAGGTNGTYLKFSVNSSAAVNTPIDILTLKSAFVGGTTAQFDALIKANNGISFPTQSPASSGTVSSSTLDAYEEGTWTPVVRFGTSSPTTISSYVAAYTRIGNIVYIQVSLNYVGNTGSGDLFIEGLPYAVGSSASFGDVQGTARWTGISTGSGNQMSPYFYAAQSKIAPQIIGGAGYLGAVNSSMVSNGWYLYGCEGFYMI